MRRHLHAPIALTAYLLVAPVTAAADAPPAAEVFGALPQTDDVVLSPDGNTLAWGVLSGAQQKILVVDVASGKDKRLQLIEAGSKLRRLNWSDNETLLIDVSITDPRARNEKDRREYFRIIALNVNTGQNSLLLMSGGGYLAYGTGASLLATHTSKPKTVIMAAYDFKATEHRMETGSRLAGHRQDSGMLLNVYEVDTRTGNGKLIEEGSPFTSEWVVNKDGDAVARSEWNPDGKIYRILARNGLGWHEVFHKEKHGDLDLAGTTPDGTAIIATGSFADDNRKLLAIPVDGSPLRVLADDPQHEVQAVVRDRFTYVPIAAILGGAEISYKWLDPEEQQRYQAVSKAFSGKNVQLYSESQDHQRVIAYVSASSAPDTFYLVDFKTHKASTIGEAYPALANVSLGQLKPITYPARDGTQIPAYLTLPPGVAAKNLPLVVLPHGGPEDRDWPLFDWWPQFLATRGYAVLQPQFRGSSGFGDAFRLAGRLQWGGLMQDDVTDGVKFVTSQGIADPRRVCIVGASYGGYAALAGAAFTPELYVCAVSINGVASLPQMLQWTEQHNGTESNSLAYWHESMGTHLEALQAHSPLNAAANVHAPVLIMYSSDDTVVPPSQSQEMARALTENGKSVKLVKLQGDDHWLSNGQTRTQMLRELETFLAAQLH